MNVLLIRIKKYNCKMCCYESNVELCNYYNDKYWYST